MTGSKKDDINIYHPNFKTDSNYGFSDPVNTQLNKDSIIPILADSIYKNPLSAIRELYNNELTACKKAKKENQEIIITFDTVTRELTINGINSLGISNEIFKKVLTVMGNSSNNDSENIGYFGLGFFSHVKISEKMIIHTKTDKEEYSFISKSGLSFEYLPVEFSEKLKTTGTKIILTIKDSIEYYDLLEYIKEIVLLSPIKTSLFIDLEKIELNQYSGLKNYVKSVLNDYYTLDYPEYCIKLYQEFNEDYELILLKDFPNNTRFQSKCFLLTSPIKSDDLIKEIDEITNKWNRNITYFIKLKDERKFKPHVSRDFLESISEKKLAKSLSSHFKIFGDSNDSVTLDYEDENYKRLDIIEFLNDKEKYFYYFANWIECKTSFTDKTRKFNNMLEFISKKFNQLDVKIKDVCLVSSLDDTESEYLEKYGILLLKVNPKNKERFLAYFENFSNKRSMYKKYNIPRLEKEKEISYSNNDLVFHCWSQYRIDRNLVISTKNPAQMKNKYHNLTFVKDGIKGDNIFKISDIPKMDLIKNLLFWTNEGYKTLNELHGFKIFNGHVFRKITPPNIEYYAILPYYDNEKISDLIMLYLNIEHATHFNPYRHYLDNNEILIYLYHDGIFNLYSVQNIDDFNNLMEVLKIDNN